jgi:hypothetical protein
MNSNSVPALGQRKDGNFLVSRVGGMLVAVLLLTLGARYLLHDAIPFLTDFSPDGFGRFWPRRAWLVVHIAGSGLALITGPFQLWSGLCRRAMFAHRWTGRLYVAGVLLGGSSAFYLASHAGQGPMFAISLSSLGIAWWTTTAMAYVAIRLGYVGQHKEWVVRSYVVTFTFVSTRALAELGILPSLGDNPFATLVWLCWSLSLLATEIVLQGRKVFVREGVV